MVRLIQRKCEDGVVLEEVEWATMFFLLKGRGGVSAVKACGGVGKVCATMVNCRLKQIATLHNALHGFIVGRVTGTETLEANLAHQLAGIAYKLLFQVFLDVQKAYDSLNRGRCMYILRGYEMGQKKARLIAHHWDNLILYQRQACS